MTIYKDTKSGITFSKVPNVGVRLASGPLLVDGVYYELNGELKKGSNIGAIRGIDIDWNGAEVSDGVLINTTGDLLKWIKNGYSSPSIKYEDKYANGELVGVLHIGNVTINIHAPKSVLLEETGKKDEVTTDTENPTDPAYTRPNNYEEDSEYIINSGTKIINKNVTLSLEIEIVFTSVDKISIKNPYKILFKKNGEEIKNGVGSTRLANDEKSLLITPPSTNGTYTLEILLGAVILVSGTKYNENPKTIKYTVSVSKQESSSTKYNIRSLFDFSNPTTLSTPFDLSSINIADSVSIGNSTFTVGNNDVELSFDISDTNFAIGDSGVIGHGSAPLLFKAGGENTSLYLYWGTRANFKVPSGKNNKIKAIFFESSICMPWLFKVDNKYYTRHIEGYSSDPTKINPNYTDSLWIEALPVFYQGQRLEGWFFNDGAREVSLEFNDRSNATCLWRKIYVEYETTRVPELNEYVTYYDTYKIDFRDYKIGELRNIVSDDNCVLFNNLSYLYSTYPVIESSSLGNCLTFPKNTNSGFSIAAGKPSTKCKFNAEILKIEGLSDVNNIVSADIIRTINDNFIGGGTEAYAGLFTSAGLNCEYNGKTGMSSISYSNITNSTKIYGVKISYRKCYKQSELSKDFYEHPILYSDNPTSGMSYDLGMEGLYDLFTIPTGSETILNNNESALNNIIIYLKTEPTHNSAGVPVNLEINTDLENIVWFYDLNNAGYSLDYYSTTPIYTKLGKLVKCTYNGVDAVKILWLKTYLLDSVDFYDGQLEKWYKGLNLFVIMIPLGLICDELRKHGNSKGYRVFYSFAGYNQI